MSQAAKKARTGGNENEDPTDTLSILHRLKELRGSPPLREGSLVKRAGIR